MSLSGVTVTAGLVSLALGTARMFDGGAVIQTLVAMEYGTLIMISISDGSSLAVLSAEVFRAG